MAESSGETAVPPEKSDETHDDEEWRIQAEAFKTEGTMYGKGCEKVEVPLEYLSDWATLLHCYGTILFLVFLSIDIYVSLKVTYRGLYLSIYQNKSN